MNPGSLVHSLNSCMKYTIEYCLTVYCLDSPVENRRQEKSERTKETKPWPQWLSSNTWKWLVCFISFSLNHTFSYSSQTSFLLTFQFKLATLKPSVQLVHQPFVLFHHLHVPFYPFAHSTDVPQQTSKEFFTWYLNITVSWHKTSEILETKTYAHIWD